MRIILIFSLVLAALPLRAQDRAELTVTGVGTVDVEPDMAIITLGVTKEGDDVAVVMDAVSDSATRLIARMEGFGIDARDVQTSRLNLSPLWSNGSLSGKRAISGYQASNAITIRLRDLDKLGEVLRAALEDGANQMNGLQFALQTPAPVEDEARKLAVKDAQAQAQLYADAADVCLGRLLQMHEPGVVAGPAPMAAFARESAVPIAAGELGVSRQVTMTFAIHPPERGTDAPRCKSD